MLGVFLRKRFSDRAFLCLRSLLSNERNATPEIRYPFFPRALSMPQSEAPTQKSVVRNMRNKKTEVLIGLLLVISTLRAPPAFGQVKSVNLPNGKTVMLRGQVRPGGVRFYVFKAKSGQSLTVRLISPNRAVFSLDVVYNLAEPIVSDVIEEGKTSWSGRLPELNSDLFGVGVTTPAGLAAYRLEITLR